MRIGDRVKLSPALRDWGETGTIMGTYSESYAVKFDAYTGGHDCRGFCPPGTGRWVKAEFMEAIGPIEMLPLFSLEEITEWSSR